MLGGGLFINGCAKKQPSEWQSIKNPEVIDTVEIIRCGKGGAGERDDHGRRARNAA